MVSSRTIRFTSQLASKSIKIRTGLLSLIVAATLLFTLTTVGPIASSYAQETTGGLRGTIRDPKGAVVPRATVTLTGTALLGDKKQESDSYGNYLFVNLPPGTYTLTVTAPNFNTAQWAKIAIELGENPSLDVVLKVGDTTTTVEVSTEEALIDVTSAHDETNIDALEIAELPKGTSYTSLIQLAPGARNEPLQGGGPQINGGANAENSYLVEGQETANIKYGTSNAAVPVDFISEVQVKTSGIEAQYEGSMSGTINVVMAKGGSRWHGKLSTMYNQDGFDAQPTSNYRYDPNSSETDTPDGTPLYDPAIQSYQSKKDTYSYWQPLAMLGGPIWKDRIWGNVAFAPSILSQSRPLLSGTTVVPFKSDTKQYFGYGRLDGLVTSRVRVFGSWLTQYKRVRGILPTTADSVTGLVNPSASSLSAYGYQLGNVSPNQNLNVGADVTINSKLIATTRWGHFFDNYGDRGYPSDVVYNWRTDGTTATALDGTAISSTPLGQGAGTITGPLVSGYKKDADNHNQFTQDLEWYKSTKLGSHDMKFGYSYNTLQNDVLNAYTGPYVRLYIGSRYTYAGDTGAANCATVDDYNQAHYGTTGSTGTNCKGDYGYLRVRDFGTNGTAKTNNNGFFVQDAWNTGKGLTISAGVRFDKEFLPAYPSVAQFFKGHPIDFGWGDKVAPRIGASWDVMHNGKLKLFGSYGVFYDQMKLNLAIGSFGGQFWHDCMYALYTTDYSSIQPQFQTNGHYCAGSADANFAGGAVPAGLTFLENIDFRSNAASIETADPNLKPYRQHETTFGADYQLGSHYALETRWDRRRLDHVIEDAGIIDSQGNENFLIVNPGEGVDATVTGCSGCKPNIKAERSFDGVEVRLHKALSSHWEGTFSYTYSRLYGNYSGLTSTDLADGNGGRENPNNNRSFDEPYFQFNAYGKSSSGPLATDRPNALKIDGFYQLKWLKNELTNFGVFQQVYSGSPMSTYADVQLGGGYPVYLEGRGKWISATANSDGTTTFNGVSNRRTSMFTQSDLNMSHTHKLGDGAKQLGFVLNVSNLFNEKNAVEYYSQLNSSNQGGAIQPSASLDYGVLESPYDYKALVNSQNVLTSSLYGKPFAYQTGRAIRMQFRFDF